MKTVGILGGMGPEATVALMARVIAGVKAQDDADHVPLIVDQNTQVPSRIARLVDGTDPDPAPVLVMMAQRLEQAGAQALVMPCNTAHHYAGQVRAAVAIPFLDMVELSVAEARLLAGPGARVGILASPAIRKVGIYEAAMARAGLTPVYCADEPALALIRQVKREGASEAALTGFRALSATLSTPIQLIACTEFSLLADAVPPGIVVIDALDVLVRAIIAFSEGAAHG